MIYTAAAGKELCKRWQQKIYVLYKEFLDTPKSVIVDVF